MVQKRGRAASEDDISHIQQKDNSSIRMTQDEHRGINTTAGEIQEKKKTIELMEPGSRSLFQAIERLVVTRAVKV